MIDEYIPSAQEVKYKQHRNLLIISGIAVIIGFGIYYFMGDSASDKEKKKKVEAASFSSPVDHLNTQSLLTDRMQNKLKEQERQMAELKNEMTQIKNNDNQKSIEADPRYQALQKQNQMFQEALKAKENNQRQLIEGADAYHSQIFSTMPGARVGEIANQHDREAREVTGIDNDELHLKSSSPLPKKNPDSFVPSGTFVEAIMLGAADASAGVQSQFNPSPMLFRIVANGTLPNHHKSHLKDCVVTAAVVGDISSERGQIRLERMSCTFPNGEIVEQNVEGTVFGMDAKNGVRGTPVWREGPLLVRSVGSGIAGGIGKGVTETYTTKSISPLGSTETVNNGDIFKYGLLTGATNGLEEYSKYNIRRAEQYHPVIQLTAGQPVDVVFLKGFYLDGQKHEESNNYKSSPNELFPSSFQTATGLTLSEHELEKIKRNEQNMGWVSKDQSGGMQ